LSLRTTVSVSCRIVQAGRIEFQAVSDRKWESLAVALVLNY